MKNKNQVCLKAAIIAVLMFTTFISCKKKDVILAPSNNDVELLKAKNSNVSIADLKIYFGELTRLDTSEIFYNSNLKKFFIKGKEQISYEDLKENYSNSPIVHYKNGLPSFK